MHIYFIRNRGEIMKQNKKIAITHYISIRFSAIISPNEQSSTLAEIYVALLQFPEIPNIYR